MKKFFEILIGSIVCFFLLAVFSLAQVIEPTRLSLTSEKNKDQVSTQQNYKISKHAVLITIDGLTPEAILKSNSPNIKSIMKNGSYTMEARTVTPPYTLPAHTSLITGLDPARHRLKSKFWKPFMGYVEHETIFTIAKKNGLKTAMFVGKNKLEYLAKPGSVDHFESTGNEADGVEKIASHFSSHFKLEKPQLTLIHFPEPDLSGHKKGWMSKDYIRAFEKVDDAIGVVIESLREAGVYDETFIIITSDHGGKGKIHEGSKPEVITIPWIAFGKGVMKDYKIEDKIHIYDTAPTVLSALSIEPPHNWDGKTIKEIFTNQ